MSDASLAPGSTAKADASAAFGIVDANTTKTDSSFSSSPPQSQQTLAMEDSDYQEEGGRLHLSTFARSYMTDDSSLNLTTIALGRQLERVHGGTSRPRTLPPLDAAVEEDVVTSTPALAAPVAAETEAAPVPREPREPLRAAGPRSLPRVLRPSPPSESRGSSRSAIVGPAGNTVHAGHGRTLRLPQWTCAELNLSAASLSFNPDPAVTGRATRMATASHAQPLGVNSTTFEAASSTTSRAQSLPPTVNVAWEDEQRTPLWNWAIFPATVREGIPSTGAATGMPTEPEAFAGAAEAVEVPAESVPPPPGFWRFERAVQGPIPSPATVELVNAAALAAAKMCAATKGK